MPEVSNLFVVLMGMGVTFFGLICLIVLTSIMGKLIGGSKSSSAAAAETVAAPVAVPVAPAVNRREVIAAVSAVIAEELGTDVSAIRIRSFKQVGGTAPVAAAGNRQEMIAAVSAAIAEDLGTDASGIRIRSFKKIA